MRILKTNVLLRLVNSYLVDSPQPANLSYLWNFGSLLAVCLGIQILTGCFLAMHYVANVDLAFDSVEHIMRDVDNGYILRYTHANVASFFFIFVYAQFNFTNFFINLFKFFAYLPAIRQFSLGRLRVSPPIREYNYSENCRPYGNAVLNIKEDEGLKFNILVLLKNCVNSDLKIHYNKINLSQLWLNYYDNITPNLAEDTNSNLNNMQKVSSPHTPKECRGEENQNQNNTHKDKEKFLQWFSGFSDAEGSFIISTPKETKEIHFLPFGASR